MSPLLTTDPIALRFLMNETVFHLSSEDKLIDSALEVDVLSESVNVSLEGVSPVFPFWGSNEKRVLFLLRNAAFDYFSPDAEDAFLKTLAALKLAIQDVVVVNLAKTKHSIEEIKSVLNPSICIYCELAETAKDEVFNELADKEGVTALYTFSFESMLTDNTKKRAFWNAIKTINVG